MRDKLIYCKGYVDAIEDVKDFTTSFLEDADAAEDFYVVYALESLLEKMIKTYGEI